MTRKSISGDEYRKTIETIREYIFIEHKFPSESEIAEFSRVALSEIRKERGSKKKESQEGRVDSSA